MGTEVVFDSVACLWVPFLLLSCILAFRRGGEVPTLTGA